MKAAELLDFVWYKDRRGYSLDYLEADELRNYLADLNQHMYPAEEIAPDIDSAWIIRRKGGPTEEIKPLKYSTLYLRLTNANTPEKLREFIENFGLLASPHWYDFVYVSKLEFGRDHMQEIIHADASERRYLLEGIHDAHISIPGGSILSSAGQIETSLEFDHADRLRVRLRPRDLFSAIFLQFAFDVEAGAQIRSCPQCGDDFGVGPNTNHSKKAIFCSAKCQNAAAYERRKKKRP